MLCEICHKYSATIHYSQVINGKASEVHMCEKCTKQKGMTMFSLGPSFSIGDLLSGFYKEEMPKSEGETTGKCVVCGTTPSEFKKTGLLGCPECYNTFSKSLTPLIRKIHGNTHYIGKTPSKSKFGEKAIGEISELVKIRKELYKAVEEERYEDAAKIRDKIKLLETK